MRDSLEQINFNVWFSLLFSHVIGFKNNNLYTISVTFIPVKAAFKSLFINNVIIDSPHKFLIYPSLYLKSYLSCLFNTYTESHWKKYSSVFTPFSFYL